MLKILVEFFFMKNFKLTNNNNLEKKYNNNDINIHEGSLDN